MNQKGFSSIFLVVIIVILLGIVGYFAFVKKSPEVSQQNNSTLPAFTQNQNQNSSPTPTSKDETADWKIYKDEQYGVQIKHPQSWYAYGGISDFSNPDLLNWRGFVPDYDANQSMEEQELLSITVYNKNVNSKFDEPKSLITQTRTNEKWEQVTVNGYTGTKITNTTANRVTNYVFERNGKIYDFNASEAQLFDSILPTLTFF